MTRLEELLIFILDRAKKEGKKDLSQFQLFKIPYLLEVYSLKYAGTPFVSDTTFIREKNGPISVDIYTALKNLESQGYVRKQVVENKAYGHPKHAFSLTKQPHKFSFDAGEMAFLDGFLSELLPLTQVELKRRAYATEPMREIQKRERSGKVLKGAVVNFATVSVDPDVVDAYSDSL